MVNSPPRNPTDVLDSFIGRMRFAIASQNTEGEAHFRNGTKVKIRIGEAHGSTSVAVKKRQDGEKIPLDSVLIFPFAGSVLVCGREQLLL
jgi:hypothetical protein